LTDARLFTFGHCVLCDHRKSTFDRFCNDCGERATVPEAAVA